VTRVVTRLDEWLAIRAGLHPERTIGFVPTMGALHRGHASLLERSVRENAITVASIFVNPAQFNDASDLAAYPRTMEADRAVVEAAGVTYCLAPEHDAIYPDAYRYRVTETELTRIMEGAHRPGHFDGVLTVVLRLLSLVRATRAYFGEKDYQQYELVRGMAEAFFLGVDIVPCPTVREPDGLALSSRNVRLGEHDRALAGQFARRLAAGGAVEAVRRDLEGMGIRVEYVEERWGRRFAAVVLGGVRLI
jgi:pantoate--beta-alanine ligase